MNSVEMQKSNLEVRGFQPGCRDPKRGREPEGSRVDTLCAQLYCICFIRVLDRGRWVIEVCYNGSRNKKVWKPLLWANQNFTL